MAKPEYFDGQEWQPLSNGAEVSVKEADNTPIPITGNMVISSGSIDMDLGPELNALSTFADTGIVCRTGIGEYAGRTLIAGENIIITNPDGIDGDPVIASTTTSSDIITLTGAVEGTGEIKDPINTNLNTNITINGVTQEYQWQETELDTPTLHYFVPHANFKQSVEQKAIGKGHSTWETLYETAGNPRDEGGGAAIITIKATLPIRPSGELQTLEFLKLYVNGLTGNIYGGMQVNGVVEMNQNRITGVEAPLSNQDATNKEYVDNSLSDLHDDLNAIPPTITAIMHGYIEVDYDTNLQYGDHLKFSDISFTRGDDIILDQTSPYTTTAGANSIGRITLLSGKTYKLTGSLNNIETSGFTGCQWFNADTDTPIGIAALSPSPNSMIPQSPSAVAIAYLSVNSALKVELRLIGGAFNIVYGAQNSIFGSPWFTIEEI